MSDGNPLVEVIIFLPIRRSFRKQESPPVDGDFTGLHGEGASSLSPDYNWPESVHQRTGGAARFQTFHYHLPPGLRGKVETGHLVWAPFGAQEVQGIVVGPAASSPVETRAIDRLARLQPVLTPAQLDIAFWIADYYVAPISEAVKLFLTPGLLSKSGEPPRVRAKQEEQIELLIDPSSIRERLLGLEHQSKQALVLGALLAAPSHSWPLNNLLTAGCLSNRGPISALEEKELVRVVDDKVMLAQPPGAAEDAILALKHASKFEPVLQALARAKAPMWKTDLYASVKTNLDSLRKLQDAGLIRLEHKVRYRDPLGGRIYPRTSPLVLTDQQQNVWDEIRVTCYTTVGSVATDPDTVSKGAASSSIRSQCFLLHGATGSGKTEIYLRAIAETLACNRQAIVLVPEIALTPQTVARFAGRFPDRVSVVHSGLNASQRYDVWRRARDGHIDVIVGARSALFSPLPRLGLIIVDEEHESTYKQDTDEWGSFTVFYDARTIAVRLAAVTDSVLIFGTATPSLHAYHGAKQGRLKLLEMPYRVMGHGEQDEALAEQGTGPLSPPAYAALPPVEIVDMRQELRAGNRSIFSRSLQSELHAVLDDGQQAILFMNRRGTHSFVMCRDCGFVAECERCETPLTYHERAAQLICHRCNARDPIPENCPACHSHRIRFFGTGTQRIEEVVSQIAPRARLLRWDRDTTGRKSSHEQILDRFASHEADVLIGTQMIAKGLDLPLVTLVGVVAADVGLYMPDFRGAERTFQLLTQVAGRAGRSHRGGRVVFQSYTPQHYALQAAAQHDYHAFYRREMDFRREQQYPPVSRLARLIFWHKKLETVVEQTERMMMNLENRAEEIGIWGDGTDLLGPAPAPYARIRGYYRWQIIVRAADPSALLQGIDIPFGWRIDIDPVSMM
ncbi:MAG: primosomal protein N' [Caldilineaceae bacterium SB0675_bin_29]|uniref:Replication restart protein PriA n=1 Tax=Caldilineaceae bacterium SB0675_bin_29 TaxID=2605266 RepID=A0A6B1G362_9CHLR|nr:primosomal protein N' [Caldilineaceae bacterium SB0675_bin_29]